MIFWTCHTMTPAKTSRPISRRIAGVGTQRPVQRKQVTKNHQHRRGQETAQHRPDNEAPSLCPWQFLVGVTGHVHLQLGHVRQC